MSAKGQKRTLPIRSPRRRGRAARAAPAERLGGLEINRQFKLDRLLDRQVGGLRAHQDAIHIGGPAPAIWRVSSLTAAILIAVFTVSWPLIRRVVTDAPFPVMAKLYFSIQALTAIFLLMVALGTLFGPAAGHFAVGVSVFMLTSWVSVLLSLEILVDTHSRERKPK